MSRKAQMGKRAQHWLARLKSCSLVEQRRAAAEVWEEWSDFSEVPIDIGAFITSPEYLNCRIKERDDDDGEIRRSVYDDMAELFSGEYDEAAFVEAIGSGKSFKVSVAVTYMTYWILCMKNPQRTVGLARNSKIAIMNMATSATQAKDVVFGEIKNRVDGSPWFQTYGVPDPRIKSRLRFPKNINIIPGSGSEKAPLGYSIIAAVMDEAAFYHQPGVTSARTARDQAEEIYTAMSRRIFSRYGHLKKRFPVLFLLMMISSPRYEDDFIERKFNEARSNPRIFARRRALWEAMPIGTYSKKTFYDEEIRTRIPVDFQAEWNKNPHRARRDLAAQPSAALNPYMDCTKLESIMNESQLEDPVAQRDRWGYPLEWYEWFRGDPKHKYYAHIDLGLSRDACGIALGHWDHERSKAAIDLVLQIRTNEKKVLQFERVRAIIFDMRRFGHRMEKVSYDNFQSVDSRQILESKGIPTEHLSTDRTLEPYDTMLGFINQGELDVRHSETLLRECKRLELVDGKKVDHPPNGSKDLADAVAGVCFHLGMERSEARPGHAISVSRRARAMARMSRRRPI